MDIEHVGKSLPPCTVACFKNAGYDNAPAIMQMTTEGPQNTLDQIEEFIIVALRVRLTTMIIMA